MESVIEDRMACLAIANAAAGMDGKAAVELHRRFASQLKLLRNGIAGENHTSEPECETALSLEDFKRQMGEV